MTEHDDPAPNRTVDIHTGLEIIRILGHIWVILTGLLALTPTLSTETSLLVSAGLPYWTLGLTLLVGGLWITAARIIGNWWLFAVGDVLIGSMCFAMVTIMLIGSINDRASYLSVMLWLLPASLFQLHAILRWRWK